MKKTVKIILITSIIIGFICIFICTGYPNPSKITLNENYCEIYIDGGYRLYATVEPMEVRNSKVVWSSSDNSIVSVDEKGYISGVSLGEALVTARTTNNMKAVCRVKVKPHRVIDVELEYDYYDNIAVGETATFTAIVKPEYATFKNVVWSSSNPSVVSVDQSGNIVALSVGEANIIATADGVSAGYTIHVKNNIEADSIEFTSWCSSLQPNESFQFKCSLEPANITDQTLTWTSSNEGVATVDENGNVTAIAPGFTTITVRTSNDIVVDRLIEVFVKATSIQITGYEDLDVVDGVLAMRFGSSVQLSCIVSPTNATHTNVKWSLDVPKYHEKYVTITDDGLLTINSFITVTVVAEIDGCKSTIKIQGTYLPN